MVINFDKTVSSSITNKRNVLDFRYSISGIELNKVEEFRHLGVILANTLHWTNHVDYACAKDYLKLGFLRRHLRHTNRNTRLAAYKCYVRPILEYVGCVWDPYRKQQVAQIERTQNLALRFVFSEYRRAESVTTMRNEVQLD